MVKPDVWNPDKTQVAEYHDVEQRKWLLAPHHRKWPLVQVKKYLQQKGLLASHQWKWPLMQILLINKTQRQMVGQSSCLAPTDPEAPPMSVGQRAQQK